MPAPVDARQAARLQFRSAARPPRLSGCRRCSQPWAAGTSPRSGSRARVRAVDRPARAACRSATPRMLFLNEQGPGELRAAVAAAGGWTKAAFDVKSLIGKTQVVWVYQATCKLSGWSVALKCYRKDQQSQINHQCVVNRRRAARAADAVPAHLSACMHSNVRGATGAASVCRLTAQKWHAGDVPRRLRAKLRQSHVRAGRLSAR